VAESEAPFDEFPIEQIARVHGIAAGLFIPFAIHRLTRTAGETACGLDVEFVGIDGVAHATRQLRITWQAESVLVCRPACKKML
jgi:hypothetical protein